MGCPLDAFELTIRG